MKRKTTLYCLLLALAGLLLNACKNDKNSDADSLNTSDRNFITMVTEANMAEIDAGTTASTKGTDAAVRNFGQLMVTEHTMAKASLDSLALVLSVATADTLSAEHQALKQRLAAANGFMFDTMYMAAQVKDHNVVINMFNNEINNGEHPSVKGYAMRFLHHIQMHEEMADSILQTLH